MNSPGKPRFIDVLRADIEDGIRCEFPHNPILAEKALLLCAATWCGMLGGSLFVAVQRYLVLRWPVLAFDEVNSVVPGLVMFVIIPGLVFFVVRDSWPLCYGVIEISFGIALGVPAIPKLGVLKQLPGQEIARQALPGWGGAHLLGGQRKRHHSARDQQFKVY